MSSVKAQVTETVVSPPPTIGFSGAAAVDADGKFVGLVQIKPAVVAGLATNATPTTQAALVPADTVRDFLKANGVNATGGSTDAKSSVVRVICVRK